MERLFTFDVDGTLTEPREQIYPGFADFLRRFLRNHKVVLVSGSDLAKLKEQLPDWLLANCERVYTCSGAECWAFGKLIHRKEHEFSKAIVESCEAFVEMSDYPERCGNHIERRPGMINVSAIGRKATGDQRKRYFEWDSHAGERKRFVDRINRVGGPYEASAGGEISIDIVPRGWNKSVVLGELLALYPGHAMAFFGDRTEPGGNDWPLAEAIRQKGAPHSVYGVKSCYETWRLLLEYEEAYRERGRAA